MTDEELKALGLDMPPPAAVAPSGPAPIISGPTQFPSSILGDKIPAGAQIPTSHQQGKEEFQQYMPKITATPGSTDYFRQRQEQLDYKSQHPWGDPISPHPGVLGHILHGLSVAGNIAGDIVDPGAMSLIPGTQLHNSMLSRGNEAGIKQGEENDKDEAQTGLTEATTAHTKAETDALENPTAKVGATPEEMTIHDLMAGNNGAPQINPATKKPYSYLEAYHAVQQAKQAPEKPEKPDNAEQQFIDEFQRTHKGASVAQALRAYTDTTQRPPQTLMVIPGPNGQQKVIAAKPGMTIASNAEKPGESATANRADIRAHDKAYVQPAEAVEKSYQMMDEAYREYEAARAQGKELPTGAQSMLALSTHLSTTFGNVKGARVTKDMIQEHLGARSISDSALVAFQKLTDGDALSPAQWDAFHDLVSKSRTLSWQTAAKEADRKHIPVDFLPGDLQNTNHEPGASASSKKDSLGIL